MNEPTTPASGTCTCARTHAPIHGCSHRVEPAVVTWPAAVMHGCSHRVESHNLRKRDPREEGDCEAPVRRVIAAACGCDYFGVAVAAVTRRSHVRWAHSVIIL